MDVQAEPFSVSIEGGAVLVDGAGGTVATLTPGAAIRSSHRLLEGAAIAAAMSGREKLASSTVPRQLAAMVMSSELTPAVDRLKAFRASWNEGDVIDEAGHLTAADLDAIIAAVTTTPEDAVIDKLGDFA